MDDAEEVLLLTLFFFRSTNSFSTVPLGINSESIKISEIVLFPSSGVSIALG
jgi:hypothetical protein